MIAHPIARVRLPLRCKERLRGRPTCSVTLTVTVELLRRLHDLRPTAYQPSPSFASLRPQPIVVDLEGSSAAEEKKAEVETPSKPYLWPLSENEERVPVNLGGGTSVQVPALNPDRWQCAVTGSTPTPLTDDRWIGLLLGGRLQFSRCWLALIFFNRFDRDFPAALHLRITAVILFNPCG